MEKNIDMITLKHTNCKRQNIRDKLSEVYLMIIYYFLTSEYVHIYIQRGTKYT